MEVTSSVRPINSTSQITGLLRCYTVTRAFQMKTLIASYPKEMVTRMPRGAFNVTIDQGKSLCWFPFGSVVCCNLSQDEERDHLLRADISVEGVNGLAKPDVNDDFKIIVDPSDDGVSFNVVTIREWNNQIIQLVSLLLAQSCALEIIENEVNALVIESEMMTNKLQKGSQLIYSRRKLLTFMAQALEAQHRIVNRLRLFHEPEQTWEDESYHTLYLDLFENFEIEQRVDNVQKLIKLTESVSQLQLEMFNTRRAELLEWIIILLITFEVLRAFMV